MSFRFKMVSKTNSQDQSLALKYYKQTLRQEVMHFVRVRGFQIKTAQFLRHLAKENRAI